MFSPVSAGINIAPQPFETVEDLLYATYFDLQFSIMRLGRYYHIQNGNEIHDLWSYHHEFDVTDRPREWLPRILKVYAQVHTINGKPLFRIQLEEIKYRLFGIEEYHQVFMEDHNLDGIPDDVTETWLVIDTSKGFRTVKKMRSKGDPIRGEPRLDARWNKWFVYWIKVQILEFKETFKKRPFPINPKREV